MDGEGVAERMRGDWFGNVATLVGFLAGLFDGVFADVCTGNVALEQPLLGLRHTPPVAQAFQQFWGMTYRSFCPLPWSTRITIRGLSISAGLRRTASEMRRPAA